MITQDWHGHHAIKWAELFKDWKDRPSLNFLEIGSFEGNSAIWCLKNVLTHKSSTITCVDPFLPLQHYKNIDIDMNDIYNRFMTNIQPYLEKVIVKRGYSNQEVPKLPFNHYDFIYVDGLHTSIAANEDAVISFPHLKSGGYMIFDDYEWQREVGTLQHPKEGIDTFVNLYREEIKVIFKGYQVIVQKL